MSRHGPEGWGELILFLLMLGWYKIKPVVIVVLIGAAVIGWIKLIG